MKVAPRVMNLSRRFSDFSAIPSFTTPRSRNEEACTCAHISYSTPNIIYPAHRPRERSTSLIPAVPFLAEFAPIGFHSPTNTIFPSSNGTPLGIVFPLSRTLTTQSLLTFLPFYGSTPYCRSLSYPPLTNLHDPAYHFPALRRLALYISFA